MADAPNNDKSWWTTLPGILTAIAAIITAVGGLIAILAQTGQISRPGTPVPTASAAPTGGGTSEPPVQTNAAAPAKPASPTPWNGSATLFLLDGETMKVQLHGAQWVAGRNKLGPFETGFGNILRVGFHR